MVWFFIEPLNSDRGFQKLKRGRDGKRYKNLKDVMKCREVHVVSRRSLRTRSPWAVWVVLAICVVAGFTNAQTLPGMVDPTFNAGEGVRFPGPYWIDHIAIDRADNILIAGQFYFIGGVPRKGMARLRPDGSLDESFDPGNELNGWVRTVVPLDDGKMLLGGDFTMFGTEPRTNLLRLHADGSLDRDFAPALGAIGSWYGGVRSIQVLADGKAIVSGGFYLPPQEPGYWYGVAAFNSDGSRDTNLVSVGISHNSQILNVNTFAIVSDRHFIFAGQFDPFQFPYEHYRGGLWRSLDGAYDPTFQLPEPDMHSAGLVTLQVLETTTNVIAGVGRKGSFLRGLIRLGLDGSWDKTFRPPEETTVQFLRIPIVQSDGKILVKWLNGIARLTRDGELDPGFMVTDLPGGNIDDIRTVAVQKDGRILAAGRFESVQGMPHYAIVRLFGGDAIPAPATIYVQPTNTVAGFGHTITLSVRAVSYTEPEYQWLHEGRRIEGATNRTVTITNIQTRHAGGYTVRISNPQGSVLSSNAVLAVEPNSLDVNFYPDPRINGKILALASLPSGQLLVGSYTNSGTTNVLHRLNSGGSLDSSFQPIFQQTPERRFLAVTSILPTDDNQYLVGGFMGFVNGIERSTLVRLDRNGALDMAFPSLPVDPYNLAEILTLQVDGRVLVGLYTPPVPQPSALMRIERDGSLDMEFGRLSPSYSGVQAVKVQGDGKTLVVGWLSNVGAVLNRLNADGSLDASFRPPTGRVECCVNDLSVGADGSILVGGEFQSFDGEPANGLVRLKADGFRDSDFAPEVPLNSRVRSVTFHPAGYFVVIDYDGNSFSVPGESGSSRVYWLKPDGRREPKYEARTGGRIEAMTIQPDGKVVIGGTFTNVNGAPRIALARLLGPPIEPDLRITSARFVGGLFQIGIQTVFGRVHHFETTPRMPPGEWTPRITFIGDGATKNLVETPGDDGERFYRIRIE